jgi:hypothetical protein
VKFFLMLHAAAAITLIGSTTHSGILAYMALKGQPLRPRLRRVYTAVQFWAYLATFGLGMVMYPEFRVAVRAEYLDAYAPLAVGFFEVKEHWAGIGLFVLICCYPMSRRIDIRRPTDDVRLYNILSMALVPIVWMNLFTGLMLVSIRSV